jgi:uncharacterized MAPEG superfamily protein
MNVYPGPALVTLATSFLLFACAAYVGRCRIRFGIKAPATSGHPEFEIAYRIQANTVENSVAFLPVLWVFASSVSSFWATVLGGVWLLARVWYSIAYARDPRTRGAGFVLSMLCFGALGIGAAAGVVLGMLG